MLNIETNLSQIDVLLLINERHVFGLFSNECLLLIKGLVSICRMNLSLSSNYSFNIQTRWIQTDNECKPHLWDIHTHVTTTTF